MSELHLQDKFLVPFIKSELGYREVKPNTVTNSLIIEEDLQEFIFHHHPQPESLRNPTEEIQRRCLSPANRPHRTHSRTDR